MCVHKFSDAALLELWNQYKDVWGFPKLRASTFLKRPICMSFKIHKISFKPTSGAKMKACDTIPLWIKRLTIFVRHQWSMDFDFLSCLSFIMTDKSQNNENVTTSKDVFNFYLIIVEGIFTLYLLFFLQVIINPLKLSLLGVFCSNQI